MSTKLIKILQKESGVFSPSNNLLSIDMDPSNVTDLSKSYLHMEVNFLANGEVPVDSTVRIGNYTTKSAYSSAAIVKHATLRSDIEGLIEQQRFNNIYQQTTRQFMESTENKKASVAFGSDEVQIDANGTGHMLITLDKLFGAAKSSQLYPDYRMGQSRIELELEDRAQLFYVDDDNDVGNFTAACNNLEAVNHIVNVVVTQPFSATASSQYFVVGREYTLNYTVDGDALDVVVTIETAVRDPVTGIVTVTFTAFVDVDDGSDVTNISIETINVDDNTYLITDVNNATDSAAPVTTFTVENCLPEVYTVGQTVQIGYFIQTLAGLAAGDTYYNLFTTVVSSVQDVADVTLTVANPITIPAQSGIRQAFMFGPGAEQVITWNISRVELVQAKPLPAYKQNADGTYSNEIIPFNIPEFVFKTNLLENVNHPAAVSEFRRQVQLDAGVDLVCAINISSLSDPMLGIAQFDTYRNSLNSVDTITKDIQIDYDTNGSIYFDRLIYAYPDLRKLQPLNGSITVSMVPEVIAPEQALQPQNIVEFRLQHTVGDDVAAGMLYFYKRLTKVV